MTSRRDFLRLRPSVGEETERIDEGRRRSLALMILLSLVLCVMPRHMAEMYLDWLFKDTRRVDLSVAQIDAYLKELYTGEMVEKLVYDERPFFSLIPKENLENVW